MNEPSWLHTPGAMPPVSVQNQHWGRESNRQSGSESQTITLREVGKHPLSSTGKWSCTFATWPSIVSELIVPERGMPSSFLFPLPGLSSSQHLWISSSTSLTPSKAPWKKKKKKQVLHRYFSAVKRNGLGFSSPFRCHKTSDQLKLPQFHSRYSVQLCDYLHKVPVRY